MASCQYVMAWVTALGVVMAVAQLYGYLFGQVRAYRATCWPSATAHAFTPASAAAVLLRRISRPR